MPGSLAITNRVASFAWGGADGTTGTGSMIAVDLALLLRGSVAYAVIRTPTAWCRFTVPLGSSYQLLETLYVIENQATIREDPGSRLTSA